MSQSSEGWSPSTPCENFFLTAAKCCPTHVAINCYLIAIRILHNQPHQFVVLPFVDEFVSYFMQLVDNDTVSVSRNKELS
jgi:hypothetical protein